MIIQLFNIEKEHSDTAKIDMKVYPDLRLGKGVGYQ
jgi:hypothetical protein